MCECLSLRKVWGKKGFYIERKGKTESEENKERDIWKVRILFLILFLVGLGI